VLVSDFHYELPEELIAQAPLADRAGARMLRVSAKSGDFEDRQFREFPEILRPSDLVVFNNTRVFPARLYGRREGLRSQAVSVRNPAARDFLRGRIEVLLTRQSQQEPNEWECLVRPGRKIGVGERLFFGETSELQAEVIASYRTLIRGMLDRSRNWFMTRPPAIHFSRSNLFLHFLKRACLPLIMSKGDGLGI